MIVTIQGKKYEIYRGHEINTDIVVDDNDILCKVYQSQGRYYMYLVLSGKRKGRAITGSTPCIYPYKHEYPDEIYLSDNDKQILYEYAKRINKTNNLVILLEYTIVIIVSLLCVYTFYIGYYIYDKDISYASFCVTVVLCVLSILSIMSVLLDVQNTFKRRY